LARSSNIEKIGKNNYKWEMFLATFDDTGGYEYLNCHEDSSQPMIAG
jgi:hypothetical protein